MNKVQVFQNEQFGKIRTVHQNNEIFFVAADVCKVLEIGQVTNSLRRLENDEKALISIKGISRGNDKVNVVNEAGLYNLVLASRKPEAKAFKRWITHDVIPAIRKTGKYEVKAVKKAVENSTPIALSGYKLKYYHGVAVVTKRDLAQVLNIDLAALQYYIRKINLLNKDVDYFIINGKDLFDFKNKYGLSRLCTSLTLITESGARKIYKVTHNAYTPVLFEEKQPVLTSKQTEQKLVRKEDLPDSFFEGIYIDPDNENFKEILDDILEKLCAVKNLILAWKNTYRKVEENAVYEKIVTEQAYRIYSRIMDVRHIKFKTGNLAELKYGIKQS